MTAKEIVDQYNFSKERIESLERKKQRILDEPPIKVTDYSEFGYGNGGGIEDKYCDRVKEINDIDEEIRWLKQYVERVEKVFSWISKTWILCYINIPIIKTTKQLLAFLAILKEPLSEN